jgi:hypothetical protein
MDNSINEGLDICIKVANYLKDNNFNDVMAIKQNTIVIHTSKSRLCTKKSMNGYYAHYHNTTPHRVCISQKTLSKRNVQKTRSEGLPKYIKRIPLSGNFALIELIAHELAHHKTKGHGKKFYIKYNMFMTQLSLWIISGAYYV